MIKPWNTSVNPEDAPPGWENNTIDEQASNSQNNTKGVDAAGIASAVNGITTSALSTFNKVSSLDGNAQDTVNQINTAQTGINDIQTDTVEHWLSSLDSLPTAIDYTNASSVLGSKGNKALQGITGAMQSAGAGASAGSWGILGGGIAGTIAGIAGAVSAKKKSQRLANNLNAVATALNENINANKINSTYQTIQNMYNNDMRNIAAFGGNLSTNGTDFTTGLTYINEGGSHESNPNEGVQIGVDSQGTPNLVEEGEVVYNNYVFSNRLKVPNELKTKYKLGNKKDLTYADAVKTIDKEAKERPNDPISKKGLDNTLKALMEAQEAQRLEEQMLQATLAEKATQQLNIPMSETQGQDDIQQYQEAQQNAIAEPQEQYALGGKVNKFAPGGAVDTRMNFYPDLQASIGFPVTWNTSDMFNNLTFNPSNLPGNIPYDPNAKGNIASNVTPSQYNAFTQYAKTLFDDNPYWTTLSNKTGKTVADLKANYDAWRTDGKYGWVSVTPSYTIQDNTPFDTSISSTHSSKVTPNTTQTPVTTSPQQTNGNIDIKPLPTWMRYVPTVGLGIASLTDALGLTNKPDYTEANMIANAANQFNDFTPIRGQYIGNYVRYNPFDINYTTNALMQQAASANRNIANTSGGNRAAAMAAQSNANYQSQLGIANALRQSIESNNAQRLQTTEFNRGTDQFNAQQANSIAQANQAAFMQNRNSYLSGIAQAAALRQKERLTADANRSANLTNLFTSIGNIGRDNWARNQVLANAVSGVFGPIAKENLPLYLAALGINSKSKRGKAATAAMTKKK